MLFPNLEFKENTDQLELTITPGQRGANIFMLIFLGLLVATIDTFALRFYFYYNADAFPCFCTAGIFSSIYIICFVILAREGLNREIIQIDRDNFHIALTGPFGSKFSKRYSRAAIFDFRHEKGWDKKGVFYFTHENETIRFGKMIHPEDVEEAYETIIKFFNRCGYIKIYNDDEVIEVEAEEIPSTQPSRL